MEATKHIDVKFKKNGYVVSYTGFSKNNGEVVYKLNEELKLLEDLGEVLLGKKVQAVER